MTRLSDAKQTGQALVFSGQKHNIEEFVIMHSKKAKIALFDAKSYDIEFFTQSNKNHDFDIKFFQSRLTTDTALMAAGFDTVCAFVNDNIDAEIIEILHSLGIKLLALRCAGYNNVDMQAAYGKINIVRVPAYSPYAVAEHAVALMLTLNRKTHKAYYRTRDNNFTINGLLGFDMHGKTAGVIGTGKIGRSLINILSGFGMKILAFDMFPDRDYAAQKNIEYTDISTVYRESDVISLHCPLTEETHHMINSETINCMKHGVMIINTSRGQLIDTAALINGLKTGRVGAAGLDVYEEESEFFFEDKSDTIVTDDLLARIMSFNNVLVTSHQGFFTKEALTNIADTTLENIANFVSGGGLPNEICYRCGISECKRKTDKNTSRCF